MAKKGELVLEVRAQELGLQFDRLSEEAEAQMKAAIGDLAHAAHAMVVAKAQAELHTTRQDYLKGLTFEKLDEDSYLISLDGDYQNKLEEGYPPFDMKPGMLASKKIVRVGRRSGLPWVQKSEEDGHRYAYVPLERKPFSKAPKGRDMADAIKQLSAYNRQGRMQKITQLFKDPSGKALQGMVAVAKDTGIKDLEGLVKYQRTYKTQTGKEKTESIYINYRVVSEAVGAEAWRHPGFPGVKAFEDAERFVETELDNILRHFLE